MIAPSHNAYVFPPFALVGPLIRFLASQDCPYAIIVPDLRPRKCWWPLLVPSSVVETVLEGIATSSSFRLIPFPVRCFGFALSKPCSFMQDSASLLITYAPNVTLFESICRIVIFSFPQSSVNVPRVWKPASLILDCSYANDTGFNFANSPPSVSVRASRVSLDLLAIDRRISSLQSVRAAKPYEKQKCSLYVDLESFLSSLPSPKSSILASPKNVIRFLVWKHSKGKTKIHAPSCPNFGSHSKRKYRCPTRLATGTVNSTIGKLRAIFDSVGRPGDWSCLSPGNPAAHPSVKKYLVSITEEQAKARVSPRQAVPFFFDKSTKLCTYLRNRMFLSSISPLERYIISHDLAFFCLDFCSGDRASDLGRGSPAT